MAKAVLKNMVMGLTLPNKKGSEDWDRCVSRENMYVANKHMKDLHSTSFGGNVN